MDPQAARELREEKILRTVEVIPAGRVATYGDVGAVAGASARSVGHLLANHGSSVPWWRVVNARGELPPQLLAEASRTWEQEQTPVQRGAHRGDETRVDLKLARVPLGLLESLSKAACADLPAGP